jgi:hypothetical protein
MKNILSNLLLLAMLVAFAGSIHAQNLTLPPDNPASQDLGRLNSKLRTLEYNQGKGKAPSEYDAGTIRKYLDSCKEKAPDQDWSGYEERVGGLIAMGEEANAAESARKDKLQALDNEFDMQLDAIKEVYDLKKVTTQSSFGFTTTGPEYEAAARLIDLDRLLFLWEEIKKINTSKRGDLKFNPNYGGSIEGFKAGYPDFVDVILLTKIDENLEKAKGPNAASGLGFAKAALAYANGGLILQPDHSELANRQTAARTRIQAISKSLGASYTGNFHSENIGKAFATSKEVNLASASASDFVSSSKAGQALYIYHFLVGPIGTITKSNIHKEGLDGYRDVHVKITEGGETILSKTLATDQKDSRASSHYRLMLIPSEEDMKSDWWKGLSKNNAGIDFSKGALNVFQHDYLDVFESLSKLSAGTHNLLIKISAGPAREGNSSDEIKFEFNNDPAYYAKMAAQVESDMIDAMRLYQPNGSEPAKEARVRRFMSDRGEVIHVSRLSDLSIKEYYPKHHTKYPESPKRRSQAFQVAWKDAAGKCYFDLVSYNEIWEGKWVDKGLDYSGFKGIPIRCENVDRN